MKRIVSTLLCCLLLVGLLPISAGANTVVNGVYLSLAFPEAGKTPPGTATWLSEGYSVHAIDWLDRETGNYLDPGDPIVAGHSYTATLWIEADDGYDFNCVDDNTPNVTAYINGESCKAYKAFEYKAWAMVCVDYDFSYVPAKGWIQSVAVNVPAPVAGQKPSYDQIISGNTRSKNVYFSGNTDEKMVNGVAWYVTDGEELTPSTAVFADNTGYRVHFLLFCDEGYRFTPNARVTVNGQTAKATLDYDTFLSVSYNFPKTGSSHAHVPSGWRTTGAYHYKACTTCGDFLEQEDHKGGVATCVEKGKCTVCGYAYLETTENHVPDTTQWIARAERYHFHKCKLCGAHCDIGDHVAGPAGTPGAAVVCKDCGYIMTPAQNHTHELTKVAQVPATCTAEGNIEYYKCSGCSDLFTDSAGKTKITDSNAVFTAALGHVTSETWQKDETFHWRTCTRCSQVLTETKLVHEGEGECTACGYKPGDPVSTEPTAAPTTEPTAATPTAENSKPQEKQKGINWLLVILVGLVSFGAAITAGVIILKRKRGL